MKNYLHYGVNVYFLVLREGDFINGLQKSQIKYFELPYIEKMKTERIIVYIDNKTNKRKFVAIVPCGSPEKPIEKVYITAEVPIDGNWNKLISDIDAQRNGNPPMEVESRLHMILDILLEEMTNEKYDPYVEMSPAEPDFTHLKIGLNAYGYNVARLDQVNAHDVDQDLLKKIMQW